MRHSHIVQLGALPPDPAADGIQRRVIIKPVTCPYVRGTEISDDVLIGDAR